MIVNRQELSEIFSTSKTNVDQWLRDDCPCRGGGGRGVERRFDTAEVHRFLLQKALAEPDPKSPTTSEGDVSHHEALRRKELANAKMTELRLAEEMAAVAPVESMNRIVSEELAAVKARLREIPAKFLPLARAHSGTAAKAQRASSALSGLIEEALNEIKTA